MKKTIIKFNVIIISLFILVSCSSSNSIKSLKLDKSTFELELGQTERLNLVFEKGKGVSPEIVWSASDEKVAEVDNNGLVKAVSVGQCAITAKTKDGKFSSTSNVSVKLKSVKELKLDKSSVNLEVGSSENLKLSVVPADAAVPYILWTSSDEKVASVDNNGVIKAVSPGTAAIIAKIKDGVLSSVSNVTVNPKAVKGIKLNKGSLSLQVGSSEKLLAVLEPANAGNQHVTYNSSNTKIATVDSDGTVKAIAQGTADITVKSEDGGFTAKCTLTVKLKTVSNETSTSSKSASSTSTSTSTSQASKHSNVLFRKSGVGFMRVILHEHPGWTMPMSSASSNLEIYIENSKLCITFYDVGIWDDGSGGPGVTSYYDTGTGIDVKLESTGEILYHKETKNQ